MVTTRDPIGRFAPEFHSDPGGDILTYESESELSERERKALTKLTTLVAGVTGSTSAQAESSIAQIRQEYLRLAETARPVTPASFADGFRRRNFATQDAPKDPATVWAHFRALHDPDAFPTSTKQIASIDLETASSADASWRDAAAGHIIEVGIVTYSAECAEESRYTQLVRPPTEFLAAHGTGMQSVHGIAPEMLEGQPAWAQVSADVGALLSGRIMLAQNESFEKQWLGAHLPGFDAAAPSIDPMALSRLTNEDMPNHKLATICERMGIPYLDGHRATPDAQMAAGAFFAMRRGMRQRWQDEFASPNPPPTDRTTEQPGNVCQPDF